MLMCVLPGCATSSVQTQGDIPLPPQIALLPLENGSNDVDAPQKVRSALFEAMQAEGYRLVAFEHIDGPLKDVGVTLGGQLSLFDNKREVLHNLIPADIYAYGAVLEYGFKNAIALTQRRVELKLRFVEAQTGRIVFEGTEVGVTSRAGLDAAADATLNVVGKVAKSIKDSLKKLAPSETVQNAADMTDVVADVDLKQEMNEAIKKLLKRLPDEMRTGESRVTAH